MNIQEYLLIKLNEECSEIQKEISKILIFGFEGHHPDISITNKEKLYIELDDFYAILRMLEKIEILKYRVNLENVEEKIECVTKYMNYSRKLGILE